MNEQNRGEPATTNKRLIVLLFLVVLVFWLASWYWITHSSLSGWQDRSSFGEMFGAINSLFSGLAFAGVIYTIYLQTQELALQREELIQTRRELKRSAEAQEKSERALNEQVYLLACSAYLSAEIARMQSYPHESIGFEESRARVSRLRSDLERFLLKENRESS
ncbi:MAG TPA: hypothetical protein VN687_13155 [Blastocatellia bacterium]|nr:hypothetical protein [Blastocatellia bacterium]